MITTAAPPKKITPKTHSVRLSALASVKLTVTLLLLIAATVLIGSWCPQESQVGFQKVVDMFGSKTALLLSQAGITDIFHSIWFLALIALLTVNMVACSMQRVFPKVRTLRQPLPFLLHTEISRLPVSFTVTSTNSGMTDLCTKLKRHGYVLKQDGNQLTAEFGKFGRLAPTITHIGLLTLLAGVSITSWTGFSGFQPVPLHGTMTFSKSEHSKLWVGRLPKWMVRVDDTRREDYPTGEPKQWYSNLSVINSDGYVLKQQEISVNNPLSYAGVDIYQSSWGLDQIEVSFNGRTRRLPLRQMGKINAAFLELQPGTILIFSLRDAQKPLRLFGKSPNWPAPQLLAEIPPGSHVRLGSVAVEYKGALPTTGLQYKCDPGYPITLASFAFIILGVLLAAVPYHQVWADVQIASNNSNARQDTNHWPDNVCTLTVGGHSIKAKSAFQKSLARIVSSLATKANSIKGEIH